MSILFKEKVKDIYVEKMYAMQFGRDIICQMTLSCTTPESCILDVGLGKGIDIEMIRQSIDYDCRFYGIESYIPYIEEAKRKGIKVFSVNIEKDRIPVEDNYFDIVIANQVLEHTKEWYFIFSEVNRVLKKGGVFIVGVPNLLSWHERIRMLFGKQAHCLDLLGPHIRGITADNMKAFIEQGGFVVEEVKGSYFYGIFFSKRLSKIFCRLFPTLAVTLFFKVRKVEDFDFCSILDQKFLETNFYRGT